MPARPHLPLALLLAFAGCSLVHPGREVGNAVQAMSGGSASGSGGTISAPPAAAEPSEQTAVEEKIFEGTPTAVPDAAPAADPAPVTVVFHSPDEAQAPATAAVTTAAPMPPPPRLLYSRSETHTKLGAQQEVTPMLKQVASIWGKLTKIHWLGIVTILVGIGGLLHSSGNKESGYPAVWIKVILAGVVAVTMGDALWFWILLALAGLLYLGQKLGILRVPRVLL